MRYNFASSKTNLLILLLISFLFGYIISIEKGPPIGCPLYMPLEREGGLR